MRPNFFTLLELEETVEADGTIAGAIDSFENHWATRRALALGEDADDMLRLVPEMRRVMLDEHLRSLERASLAAAGRGNGATVPRVNLSKAPQPAAISLLPPRMAAPPSVVQEVGAPVSTENAKPHSDTLRWLFSMAMVAGTCLVAAAALRAGAAAAPAIRTAGTLVLLGAAVAGNIVCQPHASWKERRWTIGPLLVLGISFVLDFAQAAR